MKLKKGDVLSESSHYIVENVLINNSVQLKHYESGEQTVMTKSYIDKYLKSADSVYKKVEVTREDKKDGTPGIRTIWENINSKQVFTVCFEKQNTPKSRKTIEEEVKEVYNGAYDAFIMSKNEGHSVQESLEEALRYAASNSIDLYKKGEDRILRGYKIQFTSRDGRYDCVDMDLIVTNKESSIRPVNINTIKWLIYNGIQYVVK